MHPKTEHVYGLMFFDLISHLPKDVPILVSAGEIDCRGPIINVSRSNGASLPRVVEKCVSRYLAGVKKIMELGWNIIMYSPVPNMFVEEVPAGYAFPEGLSTEDWCLEKEYAVRVFDDTIKSSGMPVISLVEWIFENNVSYDERFWWDVSHINERVWPQLLIEFSKLGINLSLEKKYD